MLKTRKKFRKPKENVLKKLGNSVDKLKNIGLMY